MIALGVELCKAASAVHGAGLLHRDIKAQNVMVADDGRVVLMDFGTGRDLAAGPETGLAGTPLYLAPEVLAGESASPRSEIYSIGVLLFRLLTGSFPVRASGLADLRRAHAEGDRTAIRAARPDLPSRLARSVERAIDPEPQRRYESAAALAADLAAMVTRRRPLRLVYAAAVALALISIVWGGWARYGRSDTTAGSAGASDAVAAAPVPTAVPEFTLPGMKHYLALSPDGSQLAFVWQPLSSSGANLYVKRLGAEGVTQLTRISGGPSFPAWSPDGRSIAYVHGYRDEGGRGITAIRIVPAAGGAEQTLWSGEGNLMATRGLDWSPDGAQLVSSAHSSPARPTQLLLLSVATGEIEWLTPPLADGAGDAYPVFSPDGHAVAFVRESGTQTEICVLSLDKRESRPLMVAQSLIRRLTWASSGRSLFFASSEGVGRERLWRVSVPGGQVEPVPGMSAGATQPSIARRGGRLVFLQNAMDQNLYRADLRGIPPSVTQLVGTTRAEVHPDISPDGSRVAFVSDRSGRNEIWTTDRQGTDPTQVTTIGSAGHPRWSPDGQRLAFRARAPGANHNDIYVVDLAGGGPRRLTDQTSNEQWPHWSRDGRWVDFTSNRTDTWKIWKAPAAGGAAVQVTTRRALKGQESSDGRFLYFADSNRGIWKMPVAGGEPVRIFEFPDHVDWGGQWMVADRVLVYLKAGASPRPTLEMFDFGTRRTTQLFALPGPYDVGSGFAVSPDGTWLLYPQRDFVKSEIMLMDVDR